MSVTEVLVMGVVVALGTLHFSRPGLAGRDLVFLGELQLIKPSNISVDYVPAKAKEKPRTSIIPDSKEHLVINGWEPARNRFRYMASLQLKLRNHKRIHLCGAVLVTPTHAITAAHCVLYFHGYPHYVALGHRRLSEQTDTDQDLIKVKDVLEHPRWNETKLGYPKDIAILYLERPAELSEHIQLANLAVKEDGKFQDALCEVVGWGETMELNHHPDELRTAPLIGLSNYDCTLFFRKYGQSGLLHSHICGWLWPYSGCYGDSGGPLVCWGKVVGLTSWGPTGCAGCFPTVFTRVSSFDWWIKENIS